MASCRRIVRRRRAETSAQRSGSIAAARPSSPGRSSAFWRAASCAVWKRGSAYGGRALRHDEVRIASRPVSPARIDDAGPGRRSVQGGETVWRCCRRRRRRSSGDGAELGPAAVRCAGNLRRRCRNRRPRRAQAATRRLACCRACLRSATCSAAMPASSTRCAASSRRPRRSSASRSCSTCSTAASRA